MWREKQTTDGQEEVVKSSNKQKEAEKWRQSREGGHTARTRTRVSSFAQLMQHMHPQAITSQPSTGVGAGTQAAGHPAAACQACTGRAAGGPHTCQLGWPGAELNSKSRLNVEAVSAARLHTLMARHASSQLHTTTHILHTPEAWRRHAWRRHARPEPRRRHAGWWHPRPEAWWRHAHGPTHWGPHHGRCLHGGAGHHDTRGGCTHTGSWASQAHGCSARGTHRHAAARCAPHSRPCLCGCALGQPGLVCWRRPLYREINHLVSSQDD